MFSRNFVSCCLVFRKVKSKRREKFKFEGKRFLSLLSGGFSAAKQKITNICFITLISCVDILSMWLKSVVNQRDNWDLPPKSMRRRRSSYGVSRFRAKKLDFSTLQGLSLATRSSLLDRFQSPVESNLELQFSPPSPFSTKWVLCISRFIRCNIRNFQLYFLLGW